MSIYKLITGPTGAHYMKDKKFVAKASIPADILKRIELGKDLNSDEITPGVSKGKCIFCGAATKLVRLYNSKTIALCTEHYYSETMGKVAQQVRTLQETL